MVLKLIKYWPFILLFIAGGTIYVLSQKLGKIKEQKAALMSDKIISTDSIRRYRDKIGKEHAKVQVLEASNNGLKALLISNDAHLKKVTEEYNIKLKNLTAAGYIETTTERGFVIPLPPIESRIAEGLIPSNARYLEYKDEWFSISGFLKNDSLSLNASFINKQDILFHRKRKDKKHFFDLFRGKELIVEVINHNPYSSTKKLKAIYSR